MIFIAAVIALATAAGVLAERRLGARAETLATRLMNGIVWVLMPVVAFFNMAALHFTAQVGAGIGFGYAALLGSLGAAWIVSRRLRLEPRSAGALMLSSSLTNSGYLGLPFVAALYGFRALPDAIAWDVLVASTMSTTVGFGVGAAFGMAEAPVGERVRAMFMRNPPLWATVAGLIAPASLAPHWTRVMSEGIVFAILPLGFLAVGLVLAAEAEEDQMRFPPPLTKPVAWALGLKLLLAPAIAIVLSALFLRVPRPYLVQPAMATAISTLLISNQYGLDRRLAAAAIAWSTAVVVLVGLVVTLAGG